MLCIQYIPKTWVFTILLGVGTVHKDIAGCVLIFLIFFKEKMIVFVIVGKTIVKSPSLSLSRYRSDPIIGGEILFWH